jgi:23S rRNA (guanosine2251-2'-O)-methyltransferase
MREWIYGRNPVYEALRANRRHMFRLIVSQSVQDKSRLTEISNICVDRKIPVERVARKRLDRFGSEHQGIALEVDPYPYCDVQDILINASDQKEPAFILILDTLQDPQNLGTLLRTAEIVGVHGIILPTRRSATVSPAVVSSSSGASEHLLVSQANIAQTIATLKERGIWVIGLEGGANAPTPDQVQLDVPLALVVGNEAQGMRPLVRNSCDLLMRLPMRGKIESLNAAVAGSIGLYFAWQMRGFHEAEC